MDFNTYQENARKFATYHKELGIFTITYKLYKDIGTISEKLFNILEEKEGTFTEEDKLRTAISLGDIVNDVANMAADLEINFEEIIALNLKKLELSAQNNNNKTNN